MKYKILLTGSSGYIGSCFNGIFHKKLDIYCLDLTKPNFFSNLKKKNFFKCNLLNKKKLEKIIYKSTTKLKQNRFFGIVVSEVN